MFVCAVIVRGACGWTGLWVVMCVFVCFGDMWVWLSCVCYVDVGVCCVGVICVVVAMYACVHVVKHCVCVHECGCADVCGCGCCWWCVVYVDDDDCVMMG